MDDITTIISAEQEVIRIKKVKTSNVPVEGWLKLL